MMKDEKLHRFTAKIADVEAISFPIKLEEEEIYRKAAYHVNKLWQSNLSAQPGKIVALCPRKGGSGICGTVLSQGSAAVGAVKGA